ncbi:MAG: metal ABC transporter permease [Immundisolibacteraceae bacterium]|nr:metal ABC transporter permease [Immundisolibacteraceae bacterium]
MITSKPVNQSMDELIVKALLGGSLIALFSGPMGCFVVWRQLAYFGDALAHSALLGVALSLATELPVTLAIAFTAAALALMLLKLRRGQQLADDTLLGILSHGALALGLVVLALIEPTNMNWMDYLFGDILALSWVDIGTAAAMATVALAILAWHWQPLVLIAVDQDLASVEGISVPRMELLFMLLLALVIALAIKIVGVLLITAMLIIPAATARIFSRGPTQMALLAALIGVVSVCGGVAGAFQWDLPTGPAIVVTALLLFLLTTLTNKPVGRI